MFSVCILFHCALREKGFCTCGSLDHHTVEKAYITTRTSFFTLQACLKCAQVTHPNNLHPENSMEEVLEVDGGEDKEFLVPEAKVEKVEGPLDTDSVALEHLSIC